MVSAAVAYLPAAFSLLLLDALFMQISGVSLALTWPCRLCLLRVFCAPLLQAFPFPSTLGNMTLHLLSQVCVFIYSSHGKWVLSCGVFLPPPLSQAFPLLVAGHAGHALPLPPEPLQPAQLVYFTVPGRIPLPQSSALSAPHPLSHVSLLFLLLITQFLFFPRVEVGLSRVLCCSGPGLSVVVPRYR
jgi:hypothetical protein